MARKASVNLSDNIKSLLDKEKPERTKPKRRRKPMTEEQRAAAAERLAKARAKKQKKSPSKRWHPVCYDEKQRFKPLDDVLGWLKEAKEQAYSAKKDMSRLKEGNKEWTVASDRYLFWYGYANDINWYLKHGDWISNTYGSGQQNKTKWKVVVPAYYSDGVRKDQSPPPIIEQKPKKRRRKTK